MSMAEPPALKFGPEWLRALSQGAAMPTPPPSPGLPKYKLAEHRYGREEMLALLPKDVRMPPDLQQFEGIVTDDIQLPMALVPLSEDEQRMWSRSVNSDAVLRLTGRPAAPISSVSGTGGGGGSGGGAGGGGGSSIGGITAGGASRGIGRGGSVDRGRGRASFFQRGPSNEDGDGAPPIGFSSRQRPYERSNSLTERGSSSSSGAAVSGWDDRDRRYDKSYVRGGDEDMSGPPRKDGPACWRSSTRERDADDDGGWRVSGPRQDKWGRGNWRVERDERHSDFVPAGGERHKNATYRNRTRSGFYEEDAWEGGGDNLPEWSTEDNKDAESVGTFDATGAFMETKKNDVTNAKERGKTESHVKRTGNTAIKKQKSPSPVKEEVFEEASDRSPPSQQKQQHSSSTNSAANLNNNKNKNEPSERASISMSNGPKDSKESSPDPLPSSSSSSSSPSQHPVKSQSHKPSQSPPSHNTCVEKPDNSKTFAVSKSNDNGGDSAAASAAGSESATAKMASNNNSSPPPVLNNANSRLMQQQQRSKKEAQKEELAQLQPQSSPSPPIPSKPHTAPSPVDRKEDDANFEHLKKAAESLVDTWTAEEEEKIAVGHAPLPPPPQSLPSSNPPSTLCWYYRDPQGLVQGPFSDVEMTEWYRTGYFDMSLLVRRGEDGRFCPLGELASQLGRVPFMPSVPHQPPVVPPVVAPTANAVLNSLLSGVPTSGGIKIVDPHHHHHHPFHQVAVAAATATPPQQPSDIPSNHDRHLRLLHQQLLQQHLLQQQVIQQQQQLLIRQQLLGTLKQPDGFSSVQPMATSHQQQQQQFLMQRLLAQQQQQQQQQHQVPRPPLPPNENGELPEPLRQLAMITSGAVIKDSSSLWNMPATAARAEAVPSGSVRRWPTSVWDLDSIPSSNSAQTSGAGGPQQRQPSPDALQEHHQQQQQLRLAAEQQKKQQQQLNDDKLQRNKQRQIMLEAEAEASELMARRQRLLKEAEEELMRRRIKQEAEAAEERRRRQQIAEMEERRRKEEEAEAEIRRKQQEEDLRRREEAIARLHEEREREEMRRKQQQQQQEELRRQQLQQLEADKKERQRQQQEEEKRRLEALRWQQMEEERQRRQKQQEEEEEEEEKKKQLEAEQKKLKELQKQQQEAALKKLQEKQQKAKNQNSAWGNQAKGVAENAPGLTLAEIQKIQEKKEQQEKVKQQQQQIQQQQFLLQQHAAAQQAKANLTWANRAILSSGPAKSLLEIQQEEAEKLALQQQKELEAKKKQQKKQLQQQQQQILQQQLQNASLLAPGVWNNSKKTNVLQSSNQSSSLWTGDFPHIPKEDANAGSGFWDDAMTSSSSSPPSKSNNIKQGTANKAKLDFNHQINSALNNAKTVTVNSNGQVGSKPRSSKSRKDENVMKLLEVHTQKTDEFTIWCVQTLNGMDSPVDVPTFVAFLKDVDSPYEVSDYVRSYLGDSKETRDFAKEFLEKRSRQRSRARRAANDEENMWGPAPAVNPSQAAKIQQQLQQQQQQQQQYQLQQQLLPNDVDMDGFRTVGQGGTKKKKRGKMQKVDGSAILGFTVHAADDRINVGDIERLEDL